MTEDLRNRRKELFLRRLDKLIEQERKFQSKINDNPFPSWLKLVVDGLLVMDFVNASYTRLTGISSPTYRGETDRRIWGSGVGEEFGEYDRLVLETKMPVQSNEHAINPLTGIEQVWVGWKFPYMIDGAVAGVWGQAIPVRADVFEENKEFITSLFKF
jgi:PAS domain-containing protein